MTKTKKAAQTDGEIYVKAIKPILIGKRKT